MNDKDKITAAEFFSGLRLNLLAYTNERNLQLSNAELLTLTMLSPFLMIMSADGKIDFAEKRVVETMAQQIKHLVKTMDKFNDKAAPFTNERDELFRSELNYLAKNILRHEDNFLKALSQCLSHNDFLARNADGLDTLADDQPFSVEQQIKGMMLLAKDNNLGDDSVEEDKARFILQQLGI